MQLKIKYQSTNNLQKQFQDSLHQTAALELVIKQNPAKLDEFTVTGIVPGLYSLYATFEDISSNQVDLEVY